MMPAVVINERWLARANDAYVAAVTQNGAPTKVMAQWMIDVGFWPESLTLDAAVTKFNAAVRGAKGERLKTGELLALTSVFGGRQLLEFYAASMGCEVRPIPDAEVDAALVAGFDARLAVVERSMGEMADIRTLIAQRNAFAQSDQRKTAGRPLFSRSVHDDDEGNPLL